MAIVHSHLNIQLDWKKYWPYTTVPSNLRGNLGSDHCDQCLKLEEKSGGSPGRTVRISHVVIEW